MREFGGIGTADLAALAGTALTLLGERPTMGGGIIPEALDGWATEDALPFISSSALTVAQAVLGHQKLAVLMDNLTLVSALSFTAMSGNPEAFSPEVARAMVFGSETDGTNGVAHHGLFQMTTLARRIDALHVALGTACATNLRRIDLLCDPAFTGLNRFLAADDSGQSGVMMLEYVAAAAAGLVHANAQPASLQTVVLSLDAEEDASFASLAASRLDSTVQALATMTAVELVCSARARGCRDGKRPSSAIYCSGEPSKPDSRCRLPALRRHR
ncbi:aromatic amino acid lyase [Pseudarthrobacter sp. MDT1-22]